MDFPGNLPGEPSAVYPRVYPIPHAFDPPARRIPQAGRILRRQEESGCPGAFYD